MTHTLPADAALLVPQAPPMRLVTRLVSITDNEAVAEGIFTADSPFTGENGSINPVGLIELAAQACALVQGYAAARDNTPPREGFLVGIKNFLHLRPAKAEEHLYVSVRQVAELDGFLLADAVVLATLPHNDNSDTPAPIASLRIKAYCPPEGVHV